MDEILTKVEAYCAAVKAKAQDADEQGVEAVKAVGAALEAHLSAQKAIVGAAPGGAVVGAPAPADPARLATCLSECQALAPAPTKPAKGAAVGAAPAGGKFADFLARLIAAILAAL